MPARPWHVLARRRWFFVVLAWLSVSPSTSAGSGARIQVIETDPASPAVLGSWHRFNVRISYVSDEPIRVHGQAFLHGRKVTSATSGSPVYSPGAGEGMFWFAYTETAQVDRIVLTAYPARGQTTLAEAVLAVELRWTGEKTEPPTPANWVQRMDTEAERRHKEAYAPYMNRPTPAWQEMLFFALIWSPVAYLVAQVMALRRLQGGWWVAALMPLVPMVIVVLYTVSAYLAGSNLFPLILIFASPFAFLYLVALIVLSRYLSTRRP